jgi:hypothetical protein
MKINTLAIILIVSVLIFSCKKKEEDPAPVPVPAVTTAAHVNKMTAKVNGVGWAMISNSSIDGYLAYKFLTNLTFGAQNSFSNPYSLIIMNFKDTTGTFALTTNGNNSASYRDENSVSYSALTGSITIASIDTMGAGATYIKKFKATFSFSTDTISGKSFKITEGIVDFEKRN